MVKKYKVTSTLSVELDIKHTVSWYCFNDNDLFNDLLYDPREKNVYACYYYNHTHIVDMKQNQNNVYINIKKEG